MSAVEHSSDFAIKDAEHRIRERPLRSRAGDYDT